MITVVKSNGLTCGVGATAAVEVDLGLSINEAARILGIYLGAYRAGTMKADEYGAVEAAYSFDPEDTTLDRDDDEHFAHVVVGVSSIVASTGAVKQSEVVFFDFTKMNLVTTRNVAFLLKTLVIEGAAIGRVYYEKFVPSQVELVQLIAQRR
ncbi:hypothetical protein ES708_25906 [subsurface metagenome]|jgi:hypothetical protein